MYDWPDDPAARDPVPPGHGEPRSSEDPDWDTDDVDDDDEDD